MKRSEKSEEITKIEEVERLEKIKVLEGFLLRNAEWKLFFAGEPPIESKKFDFYLKMGMFR